MKRFLTLALVIASACLPASVAAQSTTPAQPRQPGLPHANSIVPLDNCGCEGAPLPAVVAVVNGVQISRDDVDGRIKKEIDSLYKDVSVARSRELDLQINSKLLEAEAKKRGKTTLKLLEEDVVAKVPEPTEADAQKFYDENKARISAPFTDVKTDIVSYLVNQRQREAASAYAERLRAANDVKILVPAATVAPPATAAERARVLAVVNGEQITSAHIEDSLKSLIYGVQERVYQLRKRELDLRVNDILLEQEAQKRKITTKALLDSEIDAKAKPVTEAEAQTFYDQNKQRINGEFAQIKPQIIQYLREQQAVNLQSSFAEQLRKAATMQINLNAPEPPVFDIATDDQPMKGNPAATVTIVEFTDFQCPSCAQAQPVVERLAAEYGDRVRVVIRDYPLEQHPFAQKAAEAAEAARAQGKYWEYASLLFTNQSALGVDKLKEYATRVGLDRQKFDAALDSGQMAEKVQRDKLEGNRVGVGGTPTFFVNGRITTERTYEGLKAIIEKALREKGR